MSFFSRNLICEPQQKIRDAVTDCQTSGIRILNLYDIELQPLECSPPRNARDLAHGQRPYKRTENAQFGRQLNETSYIIRVDN
jgi:hypothetical protein